MAISSPPILLLIDLQEGLVVGPNDWGPRSTPSLTPNVERLLQFWRQKSWPVLHVQHDDIDDPTNPINSKYLETYKFHASATPKNDEPVFVKHVGSPFVATSLGAAIDKLGKRKIYVAGMDSSQCISNTMRHGGDLGYEMVVVEDACAGYGVEGLRGEMVDAETKHGMALAMLTGYGKVVSTESVLKEFESQE